MADKLDGPDDLYPFAEALVNQLRTGHKFAWTDEQVEDATQDLYLAGWQVWIDQRDLGLAKNRMVDRQKNLLRDRESEGEHEPTADSQYFKTRPVGKSGKLWDEDSARAWEPSAREQIRGYPAQEEAVQAFLDGLSPRQRRSCASEWLDTRIKRSPRNSGSDYGPLNGKCRKSKRSMRMTNAIEENPEYVEQKRHYWLREDFDHLMGLLPAADFAFAGSTDSSSALVYPKSTEGAFRELRLRGLQCDGLTLERLAEQGIVNPRRGHSLVTDGKGNADYVPSQHIMYWEKADIDAAAEWLYENQSWTSWTHFCWVCNLKYGQAVKASRVAAARYGLAFSMGFDPLGLVTVVNPAENPDDYAYVRFFPAGTKIAPQEASK